MATQWKLIVADVYFDSIEMVTIVSESWLINKEELFYPPTTIASGPKLQKFIRDHHEPDEETWEKYPYNLIKICADWKSAKEFEKRHADNVESELNTGKEEEPSTRKRKKPARFTSPDRDSSPTKKVKTVAPLKKNSSLHSPKRNPSSSSSSSEALTPIEDILAKLNEPESQPEEPFTVEESTLKVASPDRSCLSPVFAKRHGQKGSKSVSVIGAPSKKASEPAQSLVPASQLSMFDDSSSEPVKQKSSGSLPSKQASAGPSNRKVDCQVKKSKPKASERKGIESEIDESEPISDVFRFPTHTKTSLPPNPSKGKALVKSTTTAAKQGAKAVESTSRTMSKPKNKKDDAEAARPFPRQHELPPLKDMPGGAKVLAIKYKDIQLPKVASVAPVRRAPVAAVETSRPILPIPSIASFTNVSKDEKIIRLLLRKAVETANNVAEILENQRVITNYIQQQHSQKVVGDIFPLPLDDDGSYRLFLEFLRTDIDGRSKLIINKLANVGGDDLEERVQNTLKAIITDSFGRFFSWAGQNGKIAVKNTVLFNLIYDSVCCGVEYGNANRKKVEEATSRWIYKSTCRYLRKLAKQLQEAESTQEAEAEESAEEAEESAEEAESGALMADVADDEARAPEVASDISLMDAVSTDSEDD